MLAWDTDGPMLVGDLRTTMTALGVPVCDQFLCFEVLPTVVDVFNTDMGYVGCRSFDFMKPEYGLIFFTSIISQRYLMISFSMGYRKPGICMHVRTGRHPTMWSAEPNKTLFITLGMNQEHFKGLVSTCMREI